MEIFFLSISLSFCPFLSLSLVFSFYQYVNYIQIKLLNLYCHATNVIIDGLIDGYRDYRFYRNSYLFAPYPEACKRGSKGCIHYPGQIKQKILLHASNSISLFSNHPSIHPSIYFSLFIFLFFFSFVITYNDYTL